MTPCVPLHCCHMISEYGMFILECYSDINLEIITVIFHFELLLKISNQNLSKKNRCYHGVIRAVITLYSSITLESQVNRIMQWYKHICCIPIILENIIGYSICQCFSYSISQIRTYHILINISNPVF